MKQNEEKDNPMLNFDEDFKAFVPDGSSLAALATNRENLVRLGIDPDNSDDTVFGAKYVYCAAHRRAHSTGWCTVRTPMKRPLAAETPDEAVAEAQALGFPTA